MERHFPRDIDLLDAVFDFVGEFTSAHKIEGRVSYALNLAVEEIFTNMVKYNTGGGERITVRTDVREGSVVLELIDDNVDPFDPKTADVVDVTLPLEDRPVGGLGLHLVKSLVDDIRYDYENRRMRVTVIKQLEL